MIKVNSANQEMYIGRLTGFRCNKCGACLYASLAGSAWCSQCGRKTKDLTAHPFVPIPEDMEAK